MSPRIINDEHKPCATIEIPLENPLPDYDIEQVEQPTPRDVDAVLVSQGFRDLVDDARGVLMDLLAQPAKTSGELHFAAAPPPPLDLTQLTGAICPGDDEVYRPGLWVVLTDTHANPNSSLPSMTRERIREIADELIVRLQLDT
jgi:hypothetical protein